MAEIYNRNAEEITVGLQSSSVCDEAILAAKRIAADMEEEVYLEDGDERMTVYPDGTIEDGWEGEWE